jgi:arginine decarboxylase
LPKAPLLNKISEYLKQAYTGFHTPGHQQGKGCGDFWASLLKEDPLKVDLTEVPGLDNLKNPLGCLRESQSCAADLFGSAATFYLVNGSTVGLQAALLALNSPGGKVIIPRHAHISILNGLILSGGEPVLVPVVLEKTWGFPLGVSLGNLKEALESAGGYIGELVGGSGEKFAGESVEVALTVQPTYQGVGLAAAPIRRLMQEKGIPQIVDEAHGTHLFFQERIPLSLQKEQADLVIQSTHKTLAALTQASMLHVNNPRFVPAVRDALNILQTTSPSYLLLASLDSVQFQMASKGRLLVGRVLELAAFLRKEILKIPGYEVFSVENSASGWYQDPSKVLVSAAGLGLTGWELAELLREKQGIVVEMCDYYYVLFLITIGHRREDLVKVLTALREIGKEGRKAPLPSLECPGSFYEKPVQPVLSPRKVYYNKKEEVALENSAGRICGAPLTVYPPGIPCLWPGQLIEKEQVEYLQGTLKRSASGMGKITVVKE